ncbi:ROK family transcriptional regulator [Nostocoides sp. HKS02]|uniref:ROK family transcriptional regulator n=1 Tax=Nostocoides sp. HKS02 TaxID=1813880 RepID=UPI0012B44218|nr:ROK family transcriptional regulator [Tetrasphaera sp. HKS02]QGN59104.1 ROK family protein [Tetrasphaera sp. HKS02]
MGTDTAEGPWTGAAGSGDLDGLARDLALTVLIHGPLSRRELADRLGVSAPTLTRLSAPLVERGLLVPADEPVVGRLGRPARPLDIAAGAHSFIGVKLAGDTLHAVRTNLRAEIQAAAEAPLPSQDPADVVEAIRTLLPRLGDVDRVSGLGLSLGGSTPDHRLVTRAPFLHWTDVPLADLATQTLGLPTVIENDLVALTVAEQWFGDGRDVDSFAILTIGAGVGYGLVTHRRLVTSPDAGVGLVGHFPVDPDGPWCADGHRGCADTMLSITGVTAQAALALRRDVTYDEVMQLARAGDPAARAIVHASGLALGRLVAAVANLTMCERIFLSGEGIDLAVVARDAVLEGVQRDRDPNAAPVDLVIQPHDADLWARGAASVAIQQFVLSRDS